MKTISGTDWMSNLFLKRLCKQNICSLEVRSIIYCLICTIDSTKKLPVPLSCSMCPVSTSHAVKQWACSVPCIIFNAADLPSPGSSSFPWVFKTWGFKPLKSSGFKPLLFLLNHWAAVFYPLNNCTAVCAFPSLISHNFRSHSVWHFPNISRE